MEIKKELNTYKIIELDYLSKKYELKINLSELNEDNITIKVREKESFPLFIFEEKISYNSFKHMNRLFSPYETIKEIYNFLICLKGENLIQIKDIINSNQLILLIKSKIIGFEEPLCAEIKLNKKENNVNNILETLYNEIKFIKE